MVEGFASVEYVFDTTFVDLIELLSVLPLRNRSCESLMASNSASNRIWVGQIAKKTSIDDVKSTFKQYGKIIDFKFVPKQYDSFAFIEYGSQEEANHAMKDGDGLKVGGSTLKVKSANPLKDSKEREKPQSATTRSSFYGDNDNSRGRNRSRSPETIRDRKKSRSRSRDQKRMFKVEIQNLPKDMTWQELKRLGGDYGKSVEYARVVSERDSALGFLEFGDRKDALHFIESLNGKRMEDSDRRLRVAWDDSDDERKPSRRASPSPVARRRH